MLSKYAIPVTLYKKVRIGVDEFNKDTYRTVPVVVNGCLVAPIANDAVTASTELETKHEAYTIAIPKGDTNAWEESEVSFSLNGRNIMARTYGSVTVGINDLVPLKWHGKINCERYE